MELKQVLDGSDVGEIRAKSDALTEASHAIANVLYQQATQAQAGAAGADGASTSTDDEVVEEGDYEVIDEEEAKTS